MKKEIYRGINQKNFIFWAVCVKDDVKHYVIFRTSSLRFINASRIFIHSLRKIQVIGGWKRKWNLLHACLKTVQLLIYFGYFCTQVPFTCIILLILPVSGTWCVNGPWRGNWKMHKNDILHGHHLDRLDRCAENEFKRLAQMVCLFNAINQQPFIKLFTRSTCWNQVTDQTPL